MNPLDTILADVQTSFSPDTPPGGALVPCSAAPSEDLTQIAQRLKAPATEAELDAMRAKDAAKLASGKGSLSRRDEAKKTVDQLRKTVSQPDRPAYPAYIHEDDVAENQWAFASARKILENFNPDTILGIERGGRLMAETASSGLPGADDKLLVIPKTDPSQPAGQQNNLDKNPDYIINKLMEKVREGQTKFALTESWFGGGNQAFIAKTMESFIKKAAEEEGKDVSVAMIFFREKLGFEHAGIDKGIVNRSPPGTPGLMSIVIPVRFLAGEDVAAIADQADANLPLTVFNDHGEKKFVPDGDGLSTREQFKRLMNPPK